MFVLGVLGVIFALGVGFSAFLADDGYKGYFAFAGFGFLLISGLFLAIGVNGIPYQIGTGEHTGYFTASQTDGIIFKATTIYFKTDTTASQEDMYCLKDLSLLPKIRELQEQKKPATISYINYLDNGVRCADGTEIIISVK